MGAGSSFITACARAGFPFGSEGLGAQGLGSRVQDSGCRV
jgi:hypothetical protein